MEIVQYVSTRDRFELEFYVAALFTLVQDYSSYYVEIECKEQFLSWVKLQKHRQARGPDGL